MKEGENQNVDYTCPMHPEIVQQGPSAFPICGMALEPIVATGDFSCLPQVNEPTKEREVERTYERDTGDDYGL